MAWKPRIKLTRVRKRRKVAKPEALKGEALSARNEFTPLFSAVDMDNVRESERKFHEGRKEEDVRGAVVRDRITRFIHIVGCFPNVAAVPGTLVVTCEDARTIASALTAAGHR